MAKVIKNKKGSAAVFLILIFASILTVVGLFVHLSAKTARQNYLNSIFDLAGRSILSEFHIKLNKDYGIFAFHGIEEEIENKLFFYANSSFNKKRNGFTFPSKKNIDSLQIKLHAMSLDLNDYNITNVDVFEEQILEYTKFCLAKNLLKKKEFIADNPDKDIELKNEQVIVRLPSYGYHSTVLDIDRILDLGIPSFHEMKESGTDGFFVNEYILEIFQNHQKISEERKTFFIHEVEYILSGKYNDKENYKKVRKDLLLLRTGLNLIHIYSDTAKREEIIALAAALTPGPGAAATQLAIAAAWAGAEAENDLRLLEQGKQVALIKGQSNWALGLTGVMEGDGPTGAIEPQNKNGLAYKDYLRILLYFEKRDIKLLRCMDLIQLNLMGSSNEDFMLKEYYGGLQIEAEIQDQTYKSVHQY